jgi:arylsulfatase A-like enzyme
MDAVFQSRKRAGAVGFNPVGRERGQDWNPKLRAVESADMKCLVLVVHGLRVDCLGCYGNDWIDTPNLDRLAAESVVFDQHFADSPDSDDVCRAWLARDGNVIPHLSAAGVDTRLVGDREGPPAAVFIDGFGKSQVVEGGPESGARLESVLVAARKATRSLARRENGLLWVDLPSLLPPWRVPEDFVELYFPSESERAQDEEEENKALTPWTERLPATVGDDEGTLLRLRRSFAGAVSHFDAQLGVLLDSLEEKDAAKDWLLILTAPYGLPLGDHGIAGGYRPWLHEEFIHIPLLVRLPGGAEAGRRVFSLTQSSDLAGTLLDAFGQAVPSMHGRGLLPLCRGEVESIRAEVYSRLRTADAEEWALRTGEWAFLLPVTVPAEDPPRGPQLYVKPEDRFEVNNVVQHHSELAEEMEGKVRGRMRG